MEEEAARTRHLGRHVLVVYECKGVCVCVCVIKKSDTTELEGFRTYLDKSGLFRALNWSHSVLVTFRITCSGMAARCVRQQQLDDYSGERYGE